ncbi:hypothetical protein KKE85_02445 [Patescibacteria group bacterium]|nr:hypothetical protein [Patescibacteria group bacterium]
MSRPSGNVYPPIVIYKTHGDYFQQVPVYLSLDKTRVTGYPGIEKMGTTYPDQLHKDYLLSNGFVGSNTGFLNITFEEYANLGNTPSSSELFAIILDDSPFIEMYYCGNIKPIIWELNVIIGLGLIDNLCQQIEF